MCSRLYSENEAPAPAARATRSRVVGVADLKVSTRDGDLLVTYALGSCLGVALHDPANCVGGLLHVILPLSAVDPAKAAENACFFVDTGVPKLIAECLKAGAQKEALVVKVAGGSRMRDDNFFEIGKRNFTILRRMLWRNELFLDSCDVGGAHSRNMSLEIGSGNVVIKTDGLSKYL